jgi:hypothetical protein
MEAADSSLFIMHGKSERTLC